MYEPRNPSKKDFSLVYESYQKRLYAFVLKRVSNPQTAEDLTSEIFEKILKSIDDFQWQGITFAAWVFRIARNHIIDYYRKQNKYKGEQSLDGVVNFVESKLPSVDSQLELFEEESKLYLAIQKLPEEDQYLIYYRFFEELSLRDIAKKTGMSETNIGTKLYRIRKKLLKIIEKSNQ